MSRAAEGPAVATDLILTEVRAIVAAQLDGRSTVHALALDAPLDGRGVGLSSLDTIAVILDVEEAFDIFFDDAEIPPSVRSLGSLVAAVRAKLAAKRPA
jgi:acyl carrier protein